MKCTKQLYLVMSGRLVRIVEIDSCNCKCLGGYIDRNRLIFFWSGSTVGGESCRRVDIYSFNSINLQVCVLSHFGASTNNDFSKILLRFELQ